jgi:hypothetical protein
LVVQDIDRHSGATRRHRTAFILRYRPARGRGRVSSLALAAGGRDNGPPGIRNYHPNYYGGFVIDPDDKNVEVVHRKRGQRSADAGVKGAAFSTDLQCGLSCRYRPCIVP